MSLRHAAHKGKQAKKHTKLNVTNSIEVTIIGIARGRPECPGPPQSKCHQCNDKNVTKRTTAITNNIDNQEPGPQPINMHNSGEIKGFS